MTWKIKRMEDDNKYALVSDKFIFKGLSRGFARKYLWKFNDDSRLFPEASFETLVEILENRQKDYYYSYNNRLKKLAQKRVEKGTAELLKVTEAILDKTFSYENDDYEAATFEDGKKTEIPDRLLMRLYKKKEYLDKAIKVAKKLL